ncbi:MAG: hypothetical protein ACRBF0_10430 [Calditrichia bacterium]
MFIRLMLFAFLSSSLIAQSFESISTSNPASFRSQALAGAVNDDLDLVYDPIDLRFVDKIRLYTNLSNLTSSEEEVFNDFSDNELLIGASWQNWTVFDWWTSVLFRYRNSKSGNALFIDQDLNGIPDIGGSGEFRNTYNAFLDTNGDGLFDIQRLIDQRKISETANNGNALLINNAIGFKSGATLGFRYSRLKQESGFGGAGGFYGTGNSALVGTFPGDPTFNLDLTITDLLTNNVIQKQQEDGDFLNTGEESSNQFNLSFMTPFNMRGLKRVELRLDGGLLNERFTQSRSDSYKGTLDLFNNAIPDFEDVFSEISTVKSKIAYDGSGGSLGASLHKVFDRARERRNDGFFRIFIDWQRLLLDYSATSENTLAFQDIQFDGLDTLGLDFSNNALTHFTSSDEGEAVYNHFRIGLRVNAPLGNKVYFGTGVVLDIGDLDQNSELMELQNNTRDFTLQDNSLANDFSSVTMQETEAARTVEERTTKVQLPVGIEYAFTKNEKWKLRFGSLFEYIKSENIESFRIELADPRTTVTQFADGNIVTQVFDNEFDSNRRRLETIRTTTRFFYGLGYQPTDNLQVDLLGFLGNNDSDEIIDANFYRSLRLSFSIKL